MIEQSGENIEQPKAAESNEKMVEAIKISTVFTDSRILQQIADKLLSEGTISGFHIDKTISGYVFAGKKTEEDQYSLEILIEASSPEETKEKIRSKIAEVIGEKWEVPVIEEQKLVVNEQLLNFIKRAEIEHKRYLTEKRNRLVLGLTALLSIATALGIIGKKYVDEHEQKIVAVEKQKERQKAHDRIEKLNQDIQDQIRDMDAQIQEGKPFTILPTDMSAVDSHEETDKLLKTVREAEFELRKIAENSK